MDDLSKFFVGDEVVRIDLEESHWVEIKKEMSIADWERIEDASVGLVFETNGEAAPQSRIAYRSARVTSLELNIVRWSFDLLLTRENISKLKRPWAEKIESQVQQQNVRPNELRAVMRRLRTKR